MSEPRASNHEQETIENLVNQELTLLGAQEHPHAEAALVFARKLDAMTTDSDPYVFHFGTRELNTRLHIIEQQHAHGPSVATLIDRRINAIHERAPRREDIDRFADRRPPAVRIDEPNPEKLAGGFIGGLPR